MKFYLYIFILIVLSLFNLFIAIKLNISPISLNFNYDISTSHDITIKSCAVNSYDTTNMPGKNGIQLIGYQIFASAEAMNMPQNLTNKLTSSGDTKDVADNNLK